MLTTFPPSLSAKARRSLQKLGVTVLTGRTVVGIDGEGVTIEDGAREHRANPEPHGHLGGGSHRLRPRLEAGAS